MKANELRIGNYISTDKGILQKVNFNTFEYLANDKFAPHDAIDPIPITEEWLLKFGFDKAVNKPIYIRWAGRFKIKYYLAINSLAIIGSSSLELKYVHQLQNLYYALTGTELEIK